MPMKPFSPNRRTFSNGNSRVSSTVWARGLISRSASSRAASRIIRCSSVSWKSMALSGGGVFEESAAGLPAEAAGGHHFLQEWARAILGITVTRLQHFQYVEADIEPDEIGQRE